MHEPAAGSPDLVRSLTPHYDALLLRVTSTWFLAGSALTQMA